jgi:drug/metabolite transporter (DMT)-like permease
MPTAGCTVRRMTSPIWVPAALVAGLFQAWRTALQQRLRAELSLSGAGLVRYLYGAPVAVGLAVGYFAAQRLAAPHMNVPFLILAAAGGLAQIVGTQLLIAAFGYRNFVVGTAFAKTEALQAAVFAWLLLGERVNVAASVGIALGVAGVLVLALGGGGKVAPKHVVASLGQPAALVGLGAGAAFALTAVLVKRATLALDLPDAIAAALATLAAVMLMQTLMHGAFVALREPATLRRVLETWRNSGQVGLLASLGSACWFIGFATAPVALVRIVGQVEVAFTLAFARIYLGERSRSHEGIGLLLVAAGVVFALTGALP